MDIELAQLPAGVNIRHLAKMVRMHCLRMASRGGSSHIASCLSCVDIVAVLYGAALRHGPQRPGHPGRDRFILSKGHAGAVVYATLAKRGFLRVELLEQHYQDGSLLSGHVSHKGIPGVELSTGSLGHGLPVGTGMAWAAKEAETRHRVYVLMSDGEMDEGSNWEAILFAAHHRLANLVAVVDYNKIQSLAPVAETIALEPFAEKWRSFGWSVRELDGHDHEALRRELGDASRDGRPVAVIAHTTKGKGVSFMENAVLWHYRTPRGEELERALLGGGPHSRLRYGVARHRQRALPAPGPHDARLRGCAGAPDLPRPHRHARHRHGEAD